MIPAWLLSGVGRVFSILGAVALALLAALQIGKRSERKDQEVDDLKSYVETKEKIDAVRPSPDRDAAVDRLRDNGLIR